ncbi:MAG: 4-hydroxy-tetrahydrodipicolinate synthase [Planctomycetes bacterium]|nr:4-hydroxy-tetrahydrodipicolinate synthase [Planctomycetota bacterium]
MRRFEGAWTALVTPFTRKDRVAWAEFERLVDFQVGQGIAGLVPTGTTGESPTLTWPEHNHVIEATVRLSGGKCFVLAGTGSNSTAEALRGSRHAVEAGAHGVLLVDCYYNGPSSLELRREYHGVIAAACPEAMVVPYVIPGRTGCALAPEDLAILAAEHPNVRAVKEATGDLKRMAHTRSLVGDGFDIVSGDDDLTPAMMTDPAVRASGVISVVSNVVPAATQAMVRAFARGEAAEGGRLANALKPLFGIVTVSVDSTRSVGGRQATVRDKFRNPLAIKTLMRGLGMIKGGCRRPLGHMTTAGVNVVRSAALAVWESNPEVLAPIEAAFGVSLAGRLRDDALWASLAYQNP